MSLRACKEIIDEDLRIAIEGLLARVESFESMMVKPDFPAELYTEGIDIDQDCISAIEAASRRYDKARARAAEAID